MKQLILATVITVSLCACSSTPKYKEMRTIEDAVSEDVIKPGMAITKKGAVVDITVEEVQEQKRKLIAEMAELKQTNKYLESEQAKLKDENKELRLRMGLNAEKKKPTLVSIDERGNANIDMTGVKKNLDEEIAAIAEKHEE